MSELSTNDRKKMARGADGGRNDMWDYGIYSLFFWSTTRVHRESCGVGDSTALMYETGI